MMRLPLRTLNLSNVYGMYAYTVDGFRTQIEIVKGKAIVIKRAES